MLLHRNQLYAAVLAAHVQISLQQYDPLTDFCRRFAHQTTLIDRNIYIDGGLVTYASGPNGPNYTNTLLLYADLDVNNSNFPQEYDNLSKSSYIPSVQGGILWADIVNKLFYLFGGEYYQTPTEPFALWQYDVIYNTWNATNSDTSGVSRVSFGAGAVVDDRAIGFYYGGWLSNNSVPGWAGIPMATSNLVQYDMLTSTWYNYTGPDSNGRAEGVMLYIPASDAGMLVYFGGIVQTPSAVNNGSWVGVPMSQIYLYDIANAKWYTQTATGNVPDMRRRFCAGVTWAADQSSYNIYLYGGLSMPPNTVGFDDVYILTIPSFTWIRWYPSTNQEEYPHHSLTCNVIDGAQMIVMGGFFPNSSACDVPTIYGMHNLNLGQEDVADAEWYQFEANVTSYQVPSAITAAVGGGPTGGATLTTPTGGFDAADLSTYFTRRYTPTNRTATRFIPATATGGSSPSSGSHTDVGAIAGGAVGGVVFLVCVAALVFFWLRRRKNRKLAPDNPHDGPADSVAELPNSGPISPHSPYDSVNKPAMSMTSGQEMAAARQYPSYSPQGSPPPRSGTPRSDNDHAFPLHQPSVPVWQPQPYYPPPQPLRSELLQQYYAPPQQDHSYSPPRRGEVEMPSVRSPAPVEQIEQSRPRDLVADALRKKTK